jgi:hypothetical protein
MWVPYHHSMARPQVLDGDGLHMWRVAANILNNEQRIADKGWSYSLELERGLTTPQHKNQHVTKCYTGPRTWADLVERSSNGKWT